MKTHLNPGDFLPTPPTFAQDVYDRCRETGSVMSVVFEWYKWVGLSVSQVASLDPRSPGFRRLAPIHVAVLRGLLNRCSRLMVAVVRLAALHKHGEATKVLNRSVAETATVVRWLCLRDSSESFEMYLAEGLKNELRLKEHLETNIRERNDVRLVVEDRMIKSVDRMIVEAGMTETTVRTTKRMPKLESMYRELKLPPELYTVVQRLGSHVVHGTWPDLLFHYLEEEDGSYVLTDNVIPADDAELSMAAQFVLDAIVDYVRYVLVDSDLAGDVADVMADTRNELVRLQHLKSGNDYTAV